MRHRLPQATWSFLQATAFLRCATSFHLAVLQTPLRYRVFNCAAASVAILILYGTVAAVALQEPSPRTALAGQRQPFKVVSIVPSLPTKTAKPTPGQIAARSLSPRVPSVFQREQSMSYGQLMTRWEPIIKKAAKRFTVPAGWIREVMRIESGGRTMMAENARTVSSQGALGLMQLQAGTYSEMRKLYGLGPDPFEPHDNIFAGAAYLRWLRSRYGFPTLFEAYNDGPGNLEQRLTTGVLLPAETRNYVSTIAVKLGVTPPVTALPTTPIATTLTTTDSIATSTARPVALTPAFTTSCNFTRPDGSVLTIDCSQVTSVRAPLLDDISSQAQSIITIGSVDQRVRENEETAKQLVRSHGGHV